MRVSCKMKVYELLCREIDCRICVKNCKLSGDFSRHGNCMHEVIQPLQLMKIKSGRNIGDFTIYSKTRLKCTLSNLWGESPETCTSK